MITMVPPYLAEPGREFYFLGPCEECEGCRFNKICLSLEEGSRYRVTGLRPQNHPCASFDGERVTVAEVEKVPTPAAIPKRSAIEGSVITYHEVECFNAGCPNYKRCKPIGKAEGMKNRIVTLGKKIECPIGLDLVEAELF